MLKFKCAGKSGTLFQPFYMRVLPSMTIRQSRGGSIADTETRVRLARGGSNIIPVLMLAFRGNVKHSRSLIVLSVTGAGHYFDSRGLHIGARRR